MTHYNLCYVQWIPVPIERTFAFFADPNNLPRITPPELHLRIESLKIVLPDAAHPTYAPPALMSQSHFAFRCLASACNTWLTSLDLR